MTPRHFFATSLSTLAFTAALVAPRLAAAQACGDTECPKGFECKTEPAGCPAIDCADGAECPPCDPAEESYCSPLPCSSDADCDSGMTCYTSEEEECTGGAAPCGRPEDGGVAECPPAPEPECTTTEVSQCVPNWALPCEAAADCGPGFTCEEVEQCGCTGSSSAPRPGAAPTPESDTEPETTREDCKCVPTGDFACHLVITACATDDDCAEGFTCIDNPEGVCSSSSDGTISCTPGDPARLCVPPYSDVFRGGARGVSEDSGGNGTSSPGSAKSDDAAANGESESDGGCSVAMGRPAAPGLVALVVAGLAAAFASRRKAFGRRTARHG